MATPFVRNLKDALLSVSAALPAAGSSAATGSIDLEVENVGAIGDRFEVQVTVPDLPSLADAKSAVVTLQHSPDDSSFSAIPGLSTLTLTGVSTSGAAAASRRVRLPNETYRYIRANVAVDASGGNNTAQKVTLEVIS